MALRKLDKDTQYSPTTGKASNLLELIRLGMKVPVTYVLDCDTYHEFMQGIQCQVARALMDDPIEASHRIQELFIDAEFPTDILGSLSALRSVGGYFSVRSSGRIISRLIAYEEDSAKSSLAGQLDSYLNVPIQELSLAARLCYSSLFNQRSLARFRVRDDASYLSSAMEAVIQDWIEADECAIVMTHDPLGDKDNICIEASYGACESLASGTVSPDYIEVNRQDRSIYHEMGEKQKRTVYDAFSRGRIDNARREWNPAGLRERLCLSQDRIESLCEIALRIEHSFGMPQDIEAVCRSGEWYVLQARPMTRRK